MADDESGIGVEDLKGAWLQRIPPQDHQDAAACPVCGALISEPRVHRDWHAAQAQAIVGSSEV
jgi:hypothetical protein